MFVLDFSACNKIKKTSEIENSDSDEDLKSTKFETLVVGDLVKHCGIGVCGCPPDCIFDIIVSFSDDIN